MADDVISVNSENAADFYATKLNPSNAFPAVEVAESTETKQEEQTETQSLDDESVIAGDEAKTLEEQKQVDPSLQKRFDKLTKQREDAKREVQAEREARLALEKRINDLESSTKVQPKEVIPNGKPQPSQFSDAYQYAEALSEWSAENAILKRDKQLQDESAHKAWAERQAIAQAEYDDYKETIQDSSVKVSDAAKTAILDSEIGPKILYHLAKNPEIAEAWQSKSDVSVLKEIGRLEERLSSSKSTTVTPVQKISKAPEPINPIRATNTPSSVLDSDGNVTGSFDDFKKAWNAGKIR